MKTKITLLIVLMVILWASPAMGITLDELPEFSYEIGQVETNPLPNRKWGTQDSLLLTMRLIDWRQTLKIATEYETVYIAKRNSFGDYYMSDEKVRKYKECNPILGTQPTKSKVNQYFLLMIGLDNLFHYKARNSTKWAKLNEKWVKFNTIISIGCVGNNFSIGINLN